VVQEAHALRARRGDELPTRGRRQRVAARDVQQPQRSVRLLLGLVPGLTGLTGLLRRLRVERRLLLLQLQPAASQRNLLVHAIEPHKGERVVRQAAAGGEAPLAQARAARVRDDADGHVGDLVAPAA
jgi:hypothetical protein